MKHYHLSGMGVIGSFFAWELYKAHHPFTWDDNNSAISAWKASTGLIYPSGDAQEMKCYRQWSQWHQGKAPWLGHIGSFTEPGAFWFSSAHPPHAAHYDVVTRLGPLYLGAFPSYHLHVQAFVQATREFFLARRLDSYLPKAIHIVSHGYTPLLDHYVWGWSRKVKLCIDTQILAQSPTRPTFYLRENRYQFAYANLVPHTPYHYAGSSTISQKKATSYETEAKYQTWKRLFLKLTNGLVTVEEDTPIQQGWRPAMQKEIKQQLYLHEGVYYAPAMGGSGVRMIPLLCSQLRSIL